MNDICLICSRSWEQGDTAVAIGMIYKDHSAGLEFVHSNCVVREVLGDGDRSTEIIAREQP